VIPGGGATTGLLPLPGKKKEEGMLSTHCTGEGKKKACHDYRIDEGEQLDYRGKILGG